MIKKALIRLIKFTDIGSAVAVRLTKITGKSTEPIHPKHFITAQPWFANYLNRYDVVLDVGCGNGQNTLKAAKKVKRIVGVEYDVRLLAIAKSLQKEKKIKNASFINFNIEQGLNFRDKSFDKVIFLDVLEHLTMRDYALTEIRRVLKNNGIMFLGVPNGGTNWKKIQRRSGICSFSDPDHKIEFTESQIRKLLGKHNFSILEFNYGTFDIPFRGIIDIVGGFSISLYKNISNCRKILGQRYPKDASGFEIVAQK